MKNRYAWGNAVQIKAQAIEKNCIVPNVAVSFTTSIRVSELGAQEGALGFLK